MQNVEAMTLSYPTAPTAPTTKKEMKIGSWRWSATNAAT
ncbi:hypothetical protein DOT_0563 [Desulfosporosinus sp. OT]|nr:hypothetical protein DOT_0563 [Desulfosporosinus sp. OT]